jgi:hypothetical protein
LLGVIHLLNSKVTEAQLLVGDTTFFFDERSDMLPESETTLETG